MRVKIFSDRDNEILTMEINNWLSGNKGKILVQETSTHTSAYVGQPAVYDKPGVMITVTIWYQDTDDIDETD